MKGWEEQGPKGGDGGRTKVNGGEEGGTRVWKEEEEEENLR